jgi:hypothetical protein
MLLETTMRNICIKRIESQTANFKPFFGGGGEEINNYGGSHVISNHNTGAFLKTGVKSSHFAQCIYVSPMILQRA